MGDFPKKLLSKLNGFDDKAQSMSSDELKKELVNCECTIVQFEKDKEADTKLTAAKEEVKELASVYNETIKEHEAKIKYIVYVLEERGDI